MPNYFYIDSTGFRVGPITPQQLQALATKGVIVPDTQLETDTGHKGLAKQISGLDFQRRTIYAPIETQNEPLNRQTYILLAIVGGWAGWHCKYAGYRANLMVHFWLVIIGVILLIVYGLGIIFILISQIIAVQEMFYKYDASGQRMKE